MCASEAILSPTIATVRVLAQSSLFFAKNGVHPPTAIHPHSMRMHHAYDEVQRKLGISNELLLLIEL
jgi:hypothetical protein